MLMVSSFQDVSLRDTAVTGCAAAGLKTLNLRAARSLGLWPWLLLTLANAVTLELGFSKPCLDCLWL